MTNGQPHKRILLKLSGEQLSGKFESGIDAEFGAWLSREVKLVVDQGVQVVIVIGGGNFARGAQLEGGGIKRVTADHIGMLATMMNALALTDIFETHHVKTRCLSNIIAQQVAEPFVHRLAEKHLKKGRVVIIAGGVGRPYLTTDTAAVALALEMNCEIVMKATKVDGVYDKDPAKHEDAKKLDHISFEDAVTDDKIKIMDKAALGLALDNDLPVIVFDAIKEGNILKAASGQQAGTLIS